jgi:hypothetical protein
VKVTTRHIVFAGTGLVGAAAATTSALSLYELAATCGIPEPYSAALPIALDVGAAVASLAWITETGTVRTWARFVAVAALAGTVAGNGVQHAITAGLLPVSLLLVLLVGASIPAMLFAAVHLAALMMKPASRSIGRKAPAAKTAASSRPASPPVPSEIESHRGQRQVIVEWVSSQDTLPTPKVIQTRWNVSRSTATRVLSEVRTG